MSDIWRIGQAHPHCGRKLGCPISGSMLAETPPEAVLTAVSQVIHAEGAVAPHCPLTLARQNPVPAVDQPRKVCYHWQERDPIRIFFHY